MNKPAGLLAVDVDGTLITDHGEITDDVYRALERVHNLNWEIIIASGRTFPAAKTIVERLPYIRYAIMSNGACTVDMHDLSIAHAELLAADTVCEVIRVARNCGAVPALYDLSVNNQHVYFDTFDGACEHFERYLRTDPRSTRVGNVEDYSENIIQVSTVASKEVIFSLRESLADIEATVMVLPFETPRLGGKTKDFWFIQIVNKDAKKHIALRRMHDILGIPPGKYVAAGDNYNDIEMLADADIGVAMGNAPEDVKEAADTVVASNNHSGLAQIVDKVILSGKYVL